MAAAHPPGRGGGAAHAPHTQHAAMMQLHLEEQWDDSDSITTEDELLRGDTAALLHGGDDTCWRRAYRLARSERGALLLVALATGINSIQGVGLKLAKAEGVPSMQLVFSRAVAELLVVCAWLLHSKQHFLGPPHLRKWVWFRGLLGGLGLMGLFHAYEVLPIGDATTLFALHPVFAVLFAWLATSEAITASVACAVFASVSGMVLIARPSFVFGEDGSAGVDAVNATQDPSLSGFLATRESGVLGALMMAVFTGAGFVIVRYAKAATTPQQLFPWCVATSAVSLASGVALEPFVWPTEAALPPAVLCVAAGIVGHCLMTLGVRYSPPGSAALVRATEILWSYTWEILIFGEHPPWLTFVGVGLDVLSLVLVGMHTRYRAVKLAAEQAEEEADAIELE